MALTKDDIITRNEFCWLREISKLCVNCHSTSMSRRWHTCQFDLHVTCQSPLEEAKSNTQQTSLLTGTYFDDWTLVRLYKLFLTERRLAKICANGVTIKSSTWLLARSLAIWADVAVVSVASLILFKEIKNILVGEGNARIARSNLSLAMLEFRDMDLGDISKSESDR